MRFICKIECLEEVNEAAKKFIKAFPSPVVFAFYGKMGAGKTTFIKAVCEEMGVLDYVTSPSFAIINEYSTNANDIIYHFDFYRIKSLEEAFDLGYEEYFLAKDTALSNGPKKLKHYCPIMS